jgi:hypothetical protein
VSAGGVEQEPLEQLVHAGRILHRREVPDFVEDHEGRMGDGIGHGPRLGYREGGVFDAGDHQHRGSDVAEQRVLIRSRWYHTAHRPAARSEVDGSQARTYGLDDFGPGAQRRRPEEAADYRSRQRRSYAPEDPRQLQHGRVLDPLR